MAFVHAADAKHTRERSSNGLLRDQGLRMTQCPERHVPRSQCVIELFLCTGVFRYQLASAVIHALGIAQLRLQPDAFGLLGCIIDLHQQLAGLDRLS